MHEKTVISVESGRHSITIDVIEKLSKAFGLEAYELLLPAKTTVNKHMRLDVKQEIKNIQNTLNRILDCVDE